PLVVKVGIGIVLIEAAEEQIRLVAKLRLKCDSLWKICGKRRAGDGQVSLQNWIRFGWVFLRCHVISLIQKEAVIAYRLAGPQRRVPQTAADGIGADFTVIRRSVIVIIIITVALIMVRDRLE